MRRKPDISLIVSSFERPANLLRCLHSIAAQKGLNGRIEVVVADDGSRDETEDLIRQFGRSVDFPIKYTLHEHDGFRLSQCRNEGMLASTADYLLFTDADCVLPSDHVSIHLQSRRRGRVVAGHCYRLDAEASDRLCVERIRSGNLFPLLKRREVRRAYWKGIKSRAYELLRISMRPRLSGSNIGVWRADCERVNGFDENFVGWGMEDTDFQRRLESIGVRSNLARTGVYHLWHPQHPTYRKDSRGTANYDYYHRSGEIPYHCENGLKERKLASLLNAFDVPSPLASGVIPKESRVAAEA